MSAPKSAQEFLKIASHFKLGHLDTEHPHPKTIHLAEDAQGNILEGLRKFHEVDQNVFKVLKNDFNKLIHMADCFEKAISEGARIILLGCGATGRLSLALESFFIHYYPEKTKDRILSFMAGGDIALIHSIEDFEDHPEFGEKQLQEIGFTENDLVVAITEGGETPFVIGAVNYAAKNSKHKPFFLFCNPESQLQEIQRSKEVLDNESIHKVCLHVGPMALSGSTRLQATSIQMYAVGLTLLRAFYGHDMFSSIESLENLHQKLNLDHFIDFIKDEANCYKENYHVSYRTEQKYGLHVLTDTTERSPTFSLSPFDEHGITKGSWCSLQVVSHGDNKNAWKNILGRHPRTLNWEKYQDRVNLARLYRFHIHERDIKNSAEFDIYLDDNSLNFSFGPNRLSLDVSSLDPLSEMILLKMLLNMHSTLVMGRMKRFQSNMMTYVKPSNNKLIDRAIRYAHELLLQDNINVSYEDLCHKLFDLLKHGFDPHNPLVSKLYEAFKDRSN